MVAEKKFSELACVVEAYQGVMQIDDISISGNRIKSISFEYESVGRTLLRNLYLEDAAGLFEFYFENLSAQARDYFPPYPLFNPPPASVHELHRRIIDWQAEDDWVFFLLLSDDVVIAVCLLKRFKTDRPSSGLAVGDNHRGIGLGGLLQTIIKLQAKMVGLSELFITLSPGNDASLFMHRKCGFIETGRLIPHYGYKDGMKIVDRHDIEMMVRL
ncbi:hypothetical protein D1BOALGB6SA_9379 [Olavius sp. associated proteobacterium Delta 1]|nr:hypothetical protein D1BOALGB6SA_9379 [Olavius sp. associated proteobacterium Delta 1]